MEEMEIASVCGDVQNSQQVQAHQVGQMDQEQTSRQEPQHALPLASKGKKKGRKEKHDIQPVAALLHRYRPSAVEIQGIEGLLQSRFWIIQMRIHPDAGFIAHGLADLCHLKNDRSGEGIGAFDLIEMSDVQTVSDGADDVGAQEAQQEKQGR